MASDAHVETFLTAGPGKVLVGLNTGSFEAVGRDLLTFVGAQVSADWELGLGGHFVSDIVNTDF